MGALCAPRTFSASPRPAPRAASQPRLVVPISHDRWHLSCLFPATSRTVGRGTGGGQLVAGAAGRWATGRRRGGQMGDWSQARLEVGAAGGGCGWRWVRRAALRGERPCAASGLARRAALRGERPCAASGLARRAALRGERPRAAVVGAAARATSRVLPNSTGGVLWGSKTCLVCSLVTTNRASTGRASTGRASTNRASTGRPRRAGAGARAAPPGTSGQRARQ